jgi:glutaredoxin
MKKITTLLILFIMLFTFLPNVASASEKVNIYVFYGRDCPHCTKEKAYLESIKKEYNLEIFYYETWYNANNQAILKNVKDYYGLDDSFSVPFTIIGDYEFTGYADYMNSEIIDAIENYEKDDEKLLEYVANATEGLGEDNSKFIILIVFIAMILGTLYIFAPSKKAKK